MLWKSSHGSTFDCGTRKRLGHKTWGPMKEVEEVGVGVVIKETVEGKSALSWMWERKRNLKT
jgi:hypothetical protein